MSVCSISILSLTSEQHLNQGISRVQPGKLQFLEPHVNLPQIGTRMTHTFGALSLFSFWTYARGHLKPNSCRYPQPAGYGYSCV